MATFRGFMRRVRRGIGLDKVPQLDPRLARMERIFRSPPMTRELAAAIKIISSHFALTPIEKLPPAWEADQNGACWGEYEALAPLFSSTPKPAKILEMGPGMGRSLVFFTKKLGWESSEIHAYDGDGPARTVTTLGPRVEESYFGNLAALRYVLDFNGVQNVTIFNARHVPLTDLPGPYDFIYSFYSIGFHWSLEHFLDDVLPLMHGQSIAAFTTPLEFRPFPALDDLFYRVVDWKTAWPKDAWLKMLVVSKGPLPDWR